MSDSSSTLLFVDPTTFGTVRTLTVRDASGAPLSWINELEFVKGKLLANHFLSQELLVINPHTGQLEAYFDLSRLNPRRYAGCKCRCGPPTANGIAYDDASDTLWVTGKDWKFYYRVELTFPDGTQIGAGGRNARD